MKKILIVLLVAPLVCFGDEIDDFCEALSVTGELSVKARDAGVRAEEIYQIVSKNISNERSASLIKTVVQGAYEDPNYKALPYKHLVKSSCYSIFQKTSSRCLNCKEI